MTNTEKPLTIIVHVYDEEPCDRVGTEDGICGHGYRVVEVYTD